MLVNVVILLDDKAKKKVDQYRFKYDRRLIKLKEPAVYIAQPVECFLNIKKLNSEIESALGGLSRFKINIDGTGSFYPDEPSLHFLVEENKSILAIKRKLSKVDIFSEDYNEDYLPNIPFYELDDEDEAESVLEEVEDDPLKYDFFATEIAVIMKDKSEEWEIMSQVYL